MEIKSLAAIATKWATVTPGRSADYEAGVRNPKKDWGTQTANAEGAYETGVQEAISSKRFSKGVREAGTEKWQRKTIAVGIGRWGPGVRAAQDDYQKGFAPYYDVIARTTLPPRYGRGDPRNYARSQAMGEALNAARVQST